MPYDRLRVDFMWCCRTRVYMQVNDNSTGRCALQSCKAGQVKSAAGSSSSIQTSATLPHDERSSGSEPELNIATCLRGLISSPVRTSARLRSSRIASFASPSAPCTTLGNSTRFSRGVRPALCRLRHWHRMHLLLHATRLLRQQASTMREAGPTSSG